MAVPVQSSWTVAPPKVVRCELACKWKASGRKCQILHGDVALAHSLTKTLGYPSRIRTTCVCRIPRGTYGTIWKWEILEKRRSVQNREVVRCQRHLMRA